MRLEVNFVSITNLTLNLLATTIVAPPSNASKWQMGFNSAFKGLMHKYLYSYNITILYIFRALLHSSSGGQIVYIYIASGTVTLYERSYVTLVKSRQQSLLFN